MQRYLMKSKIHRATITSTDLAGDLVIVISYGVFTEAEVERHSPRFVLVDGQNRIVRPQLRAEV